MSNPTKIEGFNQALDRRLGINPGLSTGELDQEDQVALEAAVKFASLMSGEARPPVDLKEKWERRALRWNQNRPVMNLRWGWAVGLVVVALLSVAVIFRQPVARVVGGWLGFAFFPGEGFVRLSDIRVLRSAVVQTHEGRSLTVVRGLSRGHETHIWLEYSDEAMPGDGAWMQTGDGRRVELVWWGWEPDEPATRGLHLLFPGLGDEVRTVTLVLPEGWRIPLEWVPGSQATVLDVSIAQFPQATPTPTPGNAGGQIVPSSTPSQILVDWPLETCQVRGGVELCAAAVSAEGGDWNVLVSARSASGDLQPGTFLGRVVIEQPTWGTIHMQRSDGETIPASDYIPLQPAGANGIDSTLSFSRTSGQAGKARITIPAVYASTATDQAIVVDLDETPRAGQVLPVAADIRAFNTTVRFREARIQEAGSDLFLVLTSEELETADNVQPYLLEVTPPGNFTGGWGTGFHDNRMEINLRLNGDQGVQGGQVVLRVSGITYVVYGPYELTIQLPEGQTSGEPQEVAGEFAPVTPTPHPLDSYRFEGKLLEANSLLAAVFENDDTWLFSAGPESGFGLSRFARLPGHVTALHVHADRGGLDYVISDSQDLFSQLYRVRFGEPSPTLLASGFERGAHEFAWSYDGRLLAYVRPKDGPGENGAREVRVVDLDTCKTGSCSGQLIEAGNGQDFFALRWSPIDYRLAALSQAGQSGMADVYIASAQRGESMGWGNLTQSEGVDDRPVVWAPDGSRLYYACAGPETEINDYDLCTNALVAGEDTSIGRLGYTMQYLAISPDGKMLADQLPAYTDGNLQVRIYEMGSGMLRTISAWPAEKGDYLPTAFSPDSVYLAVSSPGRRELRVVRVGDGAIQPVFYEGTGEIAFFTWVR